MITLELIAEFESAYPEPAPLDFHCPLCWGVVGETCPEQSHDRRARVGDVHKKRHDAYVKALAAWMKRRETFAERMLAVGPVTQERLDAVIDAHLLLNSNGYGRARGYANDIPAWRKELRSELPGVQNCVKWLCAQRWQPRITPRSANSYGLKHLAEESPFAQPYVCNGALIAAALLLELPVRLDDLNPLIGIPRP